MDKAVLLDSNVHECSERRDIRNYSGKFHSLLEVIYHMDIMVEFEFLS